MATMDMTESQGNSRVTLTHFQTELYNKLYAYKNYVIETMLSKKATEAYIRYLKGELAQAYRDAGLAPENYRLPPMDGKRALTEGAFKKWYVSSELCLEENMKWQEKWCGNGTMAVTGTPGVAKTASILEACETLGIACVHLTVAGLTSADIKGLPYVVRDGEGTATGVEYEQGFKLPISSLGAKLANMPDKTFAAKSRAGMPPEGRYLDSGTVFAYDGGIAPEFGVVLIDEFLNLDQRAQSTMHKLISQSEKGIRGLAEGSYVLPPYWIVICAMNSASEGGMARGDGLDEMSEFIRQRISADGFFTVVADDGTRTWLREKGGLNPILCDFLDYAHKMKFKADVVADTIENEDMGFLQFPSANGKISSPRLWSQASLRAMKLMQIKNGDAYDSTLGETDRKALDDARQAQIDNARYGGSDAAKGDSPSANDVSMATFTGDFGDEGMVDPSKALAALQERLELTNNILESRQAAVEGQGKELTLKEWESIITAVLDIPEMIAAFRVFFNVHAGMYHRFGQIEGALKDYLLGVTKKRPKLADLGEDVSRDMVAMAVSCKGYLMITCLDCANSLLKQIGEMCEQPIKKEDDLHKLAELVSNLYYIPLRAGRWLNDPKCFPSTIKDEVAAICQAIFNLPYDESITAATGSTNSKVGRYATQSRKRLDAILAPKRAELAELRKASPAAAGAYSALFDKQADMLQSGMFWMCKANNWMVKPLNPPYKLPCGVQWPCEPEDTDFDYEYLDIISSKGCKTGNLVSELYAN